MVGPNGAGKTTLLDVIAGRQDGDEGTVTLARDARGRIEICVADTGIGMSAEEQTRVFEPFYTTFEGGQGLGMSVVRRIIDDYGGEIRIASEPDRGAVIALTLPTRPGTVPGKE